jgi:hypothetical protein
MTRAAVRRYQRFATDAIAGRLDPWLGPVERRDPTTYRKRSIIEFWRCVNPYCRQYTPRGSAAAGMCLVCFTPRPAEDPGNPLHPEAVCDIE